MFQKCRKWVAVLLVCTLLTGIITPQVFAADDSSASCKVEVTSDNAAVRTDASKNAAAILCVPYGGVLSVTGSKVNSAGNVWFIVNCGDKTGYIYSGNVKEHQHAFSRVDAEKANVNSYIEICKCGQYCVKQKDGVQYTNALALPVVGNVLEDIGAALASGFAAEGTAALTAATAVMPYIAIFTVAGFVIYLEVNASMTEVGNPKIYELADKVDLKKLKPDTYYRAVRYEKYVLIDYRSAMGLDKAIKHARLNTANPLLTDGKNKFGLLDLYSYDKSDAKKLCKELKKYDFTYGNSKGEQTSEVDSCKEGHFYHYHLFTPGSNINMKKSTVHVFYGLPVSVDTSKDCV